jgi:hypothetical protein
MESNFQQQNTANIQAASQRTSQPSVGGLVLGLGQAGLEGASTYSKFKADPAFNKPIIKGKG